jgi:hypothetical protein
MERQDGRGKIASLGRWKKRLNIAIKSDGRGKIAAPLA